VLAEDGPDIIHHNQVKWFEIVDGKDMEAAPRALAVLQASHFINVLARILPTLEPP
jgi:hypothetical protein